MSEYFITLLFLDNALKETKEINSMNNRSIFSSFPSSSIDLPIVSIANVNGLGYSELNLVTDSSAFEISDASSYKNDNLTGTIPSLYSEPKVIGEISPFRKISMPKCFSSVTSPVRKSIDSPTSTSRNTQPKSPFASISLPVKLSLGGSFDSSKSSQGSMISFENPFRRSDDSENINRFQQSTVKENLTPLNVSNDLDASLTESVRSDRENVAVDHMTDNVPSCTSLSPSKEESIKFPSISKTFEDNFINKSSSSRPEAPASPYPSSRSLLASMAALTPNSTVNHKEGTSIPSLSYSSPLRIIRSSPSIDSSLTLKSLAYTPPRSSLARIAANAQNSDSYGDSMREVDNLRSTLETDNKENIDLLNENVSNILNTEDSQINDSEPKDDSISADNFDVRGLNERFQKVFSNISALLQEFDENEKTDLGGTVRESDDNGSTSLIQDTDRLRDVDSFSLNTSVVNDALELELYRTRALLSLQSSPTRLNAELASVFTTE